MRLGLYNCILLFFLKCRINFHPDTLFFTWLVDIIYCFDTRHSNVLTLLYVTTYCISCDICHYYSLLEVDDCLLICHAIYVYENVFFWLMLLWLVLDLSSMYFLWWYNFCVVLLDGGAF